MSSPFLHTITFSLPVRVRTHFTSLSLLIYIGPTEIPPTSPDKHRKPIGIIVIRRSRRQSSSGGVFASSWMIPISYVHNYLSDRAVAICPPSRLQRCHLFLSAGRPHSRASFCVRLGGVQRTEGPAHPCAFTPPSTSA